jgi:hypothetical protein
MKSSRLLVLEQAEIPQQGGALPGGKARCVLQHSSGLREGFAGAIPGERNRWRHSVGPDRQLLRPIGGRWGCRGWPGPYAGGAQPRLHQTQRGPVELGCLGASWQEPQGPAGTTAERPAGRRKRECRRGEARARNRPGREIVGAGASLQCKPAGCVGWRL